MGDMFCKLIKHMDFGGELYSLLENPSEVYDCPNFVRGDNYGGLFQRFNICRLPLVKDGNKECEFTLQIRKRKDNR